MIHQFLVSINVREHTNISVEDMETLVRMVVEDAVHRHFEPDVTTNVRQYTNVPMMPIPPKPKPKTEEPYLVTADWLHFNTVNIQGETESAFFVHFIGCKWKSCWLPKSQIADVTTLEKDYTGPMSISRWIAEQKGFIQ